jgi:hypothetical protein
MMGVSTLGQKSCCAKLSNRLAPHNADVKMACTGARGWALACRGDKWFQRVLDLTSCLADCW